MFKSHSAIIIQDDGRFLDSSASNRWKLSEDPNDRRDGLWIWGLFKVTIVNRRFKLKFRLAQMKICSTGAAISVLLAAINVQRLRVTSNGQ